MKRVSTRWFTILGLVLLLAPVAYADNVSAEDPDAILDLAKGYGRAELKKDNTGDPLITGRIDGTKYGIVFNGCSNGKKCDDIQFAAAWGGAKVSLDDINKWNSTHRFGVAYLDSDGDPRMKMSVNIDHGVAKKNLDDTFNWWTKAVKSFKEILK